MTAPPTHRAPGDRLAQSSRAATDGEPSTPGEVVLGRRVRVEQRSLTRRDGRTELREMVVHPGAVVLLPVLDDGRLVLIRNYRFAIDQTLLELAAGTRERDDNGELEDIALCAARELEEETGYRATSLEPLLGFFPTPGMSDEFMHVFLARGLRKTAQRLDPAEQIEVELLSVAEVLECIRTQQIRDAKTIAAVLYFSLSREARD
jgi:ADP-ribose pyrophosphatase